MFIYIYIVYLLHTSAYMCIYIYTHTCMYTYIYIPHRQFVYDKCVLFILKFYT